MRPEQPTRQQRRAAERALRRAERIAAAHAVEHEGVRHFRDEHAAREYEGALSDAARAAGRGRIVWFDV